MTAFVIENMAPIMFASLVVLLLLGYPVAFALAANGLVFAIIGIELGLFPPVFLQALPERIFGIMNNDTLLAIPFFTFMGLILERSGMAEDLLDTVGQLFGPVRGGLAFAVVLVGALLAATTGVVAASVIAMGLISLPIMLRYGYDRRVASGVIAASGTLAQIIPPSLVLIIMADQLGRSVGDMYEGAIIPGLVLTGLYMAYIGIIALRYPKATPALPIEARTLGGGVTSLFALVALSVAAGYVIIAYFGHGVSEKGIWSATVSMAIAYAIALINRGLSLGLLSRLAQQVIIVLMPPLALIFLVLGTIFLGIATPTEGGAMGAVGALLMAISKSRLSFSLLRQALDATTKLSAFVLFILIGARVFSLTFYGVNGHIWVEHLLLSVPGGQLGFLIVVNVLVFILAFFLDFFELAFIVVPLLAPVADKLGYRPDLVRRAAQRQSADKLHASAIRLCAVLSAFCGAARPVYRQDHRPADCAGNDGGDLLGRGPFRADPGHHGGADDRLSADGHALQVDWHRPRSGKASKSSSSRSEDSRARRLSRISARRRRALAVSRGVGPRRRRHRATGKESFWTRC